MTLRNKVQKAIKWNLGVSEIADSLLGGVILVLCGIANLAVYATIIKLCKVIGNVYDGHIQKYIADKDLEFLSKWSSIVNVLNGIVRIAGMIIIPWNNVIGISIVAFSGMIYGVDRAFAKVYGEQVIDIVTEQNVINRTKFYAELGIFASYCRTTGMMLNLLVFLAGARYDLSQVGIIYGVILTYTGLKILDVLVTLLERRFVLKLMRTKR